MGIDWSSCLHYCTSFVEWLFWQYGVLRYVTIIHKKAKHICCLCMVKWGLIKPLFSKRSIVFFFFLFKLCWWNTSLLWKLLTYVRDLCSCKNHPRFELPTLDHMVSVNQWKNLFPSSMDSSVDILAAEKNYRNSAKPHIVSAKSGRKWLESDFERTWCNRYWGGLQSGKDVDGWHSE